MLKITCLQTISILPIRFILYFSAALGIAQNSLALHTLARKFVWLHTEKSLQPLITSNKNKILLSNLIPNLSAYSMYSFKHVT